MYTRLGIGPNGRRVEVVSRQTSRLYLSLKLFGAHMAILNVALLLPCFNCTGQWRAPYRRAGMKTS